MKEVYEEIISLFQEAVKKNPHSAEAHCNLGVAYLGIGDRGSTMEEYKILKDLDKDLANKLFKLIYE